MLKKINILLIATLILITMSGCISINTNLGYFQETELGSIKSGTFTGKEVRIEGKNGGIDIRPWDKDYIEVEYEKTANSPNKDRLSEYLENSEVTIDINNDRAVIETKTPRITNGSVGIRMTIYVPAEVDIDLTTSNGGVTLHPGLKGNAKLKSSNGALSIEGLEGSVYAKTSNGAIDIIDVIGDVEGITSNGSIKFRGAQLTKDVILSTSNGRIDVSTGELVGQRYRLSTSNGSIDLTLPEGTGYDLDASTRSGRIKYNGKSSSERSVREPINGGGTKVEIETSNGSITIEENNR